MSDSMRPHRRQPTRLPRPWDSPGKNTGVGCHFLLQCEKVKTENEFAQSCPTLSDSMDCSPPGSFIQWDPPGKSTGVGCHCLNSYHSMGTLNLPGVSQVALVVNNLPANAGDVRDTCGLDPWVRKIPWGWKWWSVPVFLSENSHGQRSLAGSSLWGHKESDTTKRLSTQVL